MQLTKWTCLLKSFNCAAVYNYGVCIGSLFLVPSPPFSVMNTHTLTYTHIRTPQDHNEEYFERKYLSLPVQPSHSTSETSLRTLLEQLSPTITTPNRHDGNTSQKQAVAKLTRALLPTTCSGDPQDLDSARFGCGIGGGSCNSQYILSVAGQSCWSVEGLGDGDCRMRELVGETVVMEGREGEGLDLCVDEGCECGMFGSGNTVCMDRDFEDTGSYFVAEDGEY